MMKAGNKRIQNELKEIQQNPPSCWRVITGFDESQWTVWIDAELNSPFHTIPIKLFVKFPQNYPFSPPSINLEKYHLFFHPNIGRNSICETTVTSKSPSTRVRERIDAFIVLLTTPNPDSCLNNLAGKLFLKDYREYFKKAFKIFRGLEKNCE